MPGYNKIILIGNMTRDPMSGMLPSSGSPTSRFGIAVNRRYRTQQGEDREETTFVDCDVIGRVADVVNRYTHKGSLILVEGRLKLDTWNDKQTGEPRSKLKVMVDNVQLLDRREAAPQAGYDQGGYGQQPMQSQYGNQGGYGQGGYGYGQQQPYRPQGGYGQPPQQYGGYGAPQPQYNGGYGAPQQPPYNGGFGAPQQPQPPRPQPAYAGGYGAAQPQPAPAAQPAFRPQDNPPAPPPFEPLPDNPPAETASPAPSAGAEAPQSAPAGDGAPTDDLPF
ncbi:MAG: single-stranded DNA-binding protein [Victivallales bacterium]|nr:single-stranded DNA-binding protein [Victivallales bacterium]